MSPTFFMRLYCIFYTDDLVCFIQMFIDDYESVPLVALTYLTGQCNYGGRVTDERDRRLLLSLLAIFYNDQLIEDDTYCFSPSKMYFAPKHGEYESYLTYIRSLPIMPHPEVCNVV